jgi:hypothetical protein
VERSASSRPPSRSEARDAAARAALTPLRKGERPLPVTVGAVALTVLALLELGAFAAGVKIGHKPARVQVVLPFVAGSLALAWGVWRVRYGAVLLLQAVLAIAIVLFALLLLIASNLAAVLVAVLVIAGASTLFWFLVRVMARIQLRDRLER